MRRIALVCDWYHPRRGGMEAQLDGLATRLAARGNVVQVITSTPGPSTVNGIQVHRLDVPRLPWAGVAAVPVAGMIQKLLARERIDVVHNHVSIIAPVALGGALGAHRAALPNVLTFHSFVPATPLLAGPAGRLLGADEWPAVMTAVSRRVAREVEAFAPSASFSLLPNAIDTAFWTPGASVGAKGEVRLVFAGRLQAKKRPFLLLRVLTELARTVSDRAWSLTIAGTGSLERSLRDAVRELRLESRVTFAGWMDREPLRDILRSSHVFLSTAARESFGLAALEARAVGVPVVAVRDSAVADFITHEESGLLAGDDAGFAAAAARLATDSGLRERIGEFNRRTPVPFDWERTLALHDDAYDRATDLAAIRR
jgi:glycosyltransferase involved in cell wall biosynthesis